jgi:enhancer of mRNA-decapping protein 3
MLISVVTLLWNGQTYPSYNIDAPGIADLEVSSTQNEIPQQHQPPPPSVQPVPIQPKFDQIPAPQPVATTTTPFVDPAIVSFSTRPAKPAAAPLEKSLSAITTSFAPGPGSVHSVETAHPPRTAERHDSAVTAILTDPFSNLGLQAAEIADGATAKTNNISVSQEITQERQGGKRNKRGRNKAREDKVGNDYHNGLKGNGWRQTAFVEPIQPKYHTGYPTEDYASEGYPKRGKNKNRKS